jgi:tripartite-type tricarboxylate transporter receptor subunit TctC
MAMESVNSTPAEFGKVIRDEIVTWGTVVKAAGIKPQ